MKVDEVRRAWLRAAEDTDVPTRLVALGETSGEGTVPMRGRSPARWADRIRFEARLAELLGDEAARLDLQWLAPNPRSAAGGRDRARSRLGLAPKPDGPMEVTQAPSKGMTRTPAKPTQAVPQAVPGVKHVLAVASGKGGVGKSTVAVNLAAALLERGLRIGLLDADVYGPSMPTMLGSFESPTREADRFQPPRARGLPFLSLGLMVNPDQSVIWRGPLVQRMVRDMLQTTHWPDLDILVIDLPPGTGDVQLSLVQRALLAGALIVSTPQDIALIDAARAIHMFRSLDVNVLGVVENMSEWRCPDCDSVSHPFGSGGAEREAARFEVPFMGRIPMEEAVREGGDRGVPVIDGAPDSAAAAAFRALAEQVAEAILGR